MFLIPFAIGIGVVIAGGISALGCKDKDHPFTKIPLRDYSKEGTVPLKTVPLRDPRNEFCILHRLIQGQECEATPNGIKFGQLSSQESIVNLLPRIKATEDISSIAQQWGISMEYDFSPMTRQADSSGQTGEHLQKLLQLRGLEIYLSAGNSWRFDTYQDLQNIMRAYRFLSQYEEGRSPFREDFHKGNLRCVLSPIVGPNGQTLLAWEGKRSQDLPAHLTNPNASFCFPLKPTKN